MMISPMGASEGMTRVGLVSAGKGLVAPQVKPGGADYGHLALG
jgi:hypothetical protein